MDNDNKQLRENDHASEVAASVAKRRSSNPFAEEDDTSEVAASVPHRRSSNPFGDPEEDLLETAATVSKVVVIPTVPRDWESQWSEVADAIKQSWTGVTVCSPELVNGMISKHIVYAVKSEPLNYVVRRRFNDFAWLCSVLTATYEGLFIPSVPAVPLFPSSDSKTDVTGDFVKGRMLQLHLFMQVLLSIPFLRNDIALHNFLTVQVDKDFKAITEAPFDVASGGGRENWRNVGLCMWHKLVDRELFLHGQQEGSRALSRNLEADAVDEVAPAVDCDRLITDFKRQLELLHAMLKQLDRECRLASSQAAAFAASMSSLSGIVTAWTSLESDIADVKRNEYLDPYGAAKNRTMDAMRAGHSHWAQSVELAPKVVTQVLLSSVQFQTMQVIRFKEFLQSRDLLLRDLERAREQARAAEDQHQASTVEEWNRRGSRSFFSQRPEDLVDNVQRRTGAVHELQVRVDRINRALIFCELARFNKERQQTIANLYGKLAATHMQIAQSSQQHWSATMGELGIDAGSFGDCVGALSSSMDEGLVIGD
ncbi:hypothetical protein B484DRAFT_442115 [Ochromonadaceae sp. CCMP2298]|nr:hypothetical protein B484DRAFT_442115 [Ochromonadaceae sp. CCMP2298]|mmetsp:Transcript_34000/g.73463  ORF Transcript_34000/g.73463 Transcript_34000/m.73463 type:complete len:539 (-) Transcript_34000:47-1663(-)